MRTYADTIGVWKRLIVPTRSSAGGVKASSTSEHLDDPTSLVTDAHGAGLQIEAWTFRDEPQFLAEQYGRDPQKELCHFINLGVDALISDFPGTAVHARDRLQE